MPLRTNRGRTAVYRKLWNWPMRSPRHLVALGLVMLAVVLFVSLLMPRLSGSDGASETPAGAAGSSTSSSVAPVPAGGPAAGTPGGSGQPAAPGTTATSSLATRITSPPQTPTSAAPAPKALEVATVWAKAWVTHPQGISNEQWRASLAPYTTEEQLAVMSTVDPANIPATAVTADAVAKTSYTTSVEAMVTTNGGTLSITVIATPQGWRVAHYEAAA
ncbi:MAG: hypothetical protein ACJ72N_24140 [Labedaea sp.]